MAVRRKSEGFNLAFLDIMSCGLGAVILIFMLVKHNVEKSDLEIDLLSADISRLQQQEQELETKLGALKGFSASEAEMLAKLKDQIASLQKSISKSQKSVVQKEDQLAALKNSIKNAPRAQTEDVVADDRGGEENYLMGLKVEGARITIMVDSSASMTDEKLLDVIRRKNGTISEKKRGPKWVRTKKIVRWFLARIPKGSQVSLISYNNQAKTLGGVKWIRSLSKNMTQRLYMDVDKLIPQGATNLQKGLELAKGLKPTDLYVITDGLPTDGTSRYASLNPFASCSSLLGSAKTISGECRVKLFRQTLQESSPRGVKVNVVLLPIEGDPAASNEYWRWTSNTGGLLISPAANWP